MRRIAPSPMLVDVAGKADEGDQAVVGPCVRRGVDRHAEGGAACGLTVTVERQHAADRLRVEQEDAAVVAAADAREARQRRQTRAGGSTSRSSVHTLAARRPASRRGHVRDLVERDRHAASTHRGPQGRGHAGAAVERPQCTVEPAGGLEVGLVAELGAGGRRARDRVVRVGFGRRTGGPPRCSRGRGAATTQGERGAGDDESARDTEQRRPGAELDAASSVLHGGDVGLVGCCGLGLGGGRSA